jgi:predicted hydrocarbon binding protein
MGNTTAKSASLIGTFIREEFPSVDFQKVLKRLSREEQSLFKAMTADQWISYGLYFNMLQAGADEARCDPHDFCQRFGSFQVKHDTEFIYKMAIKFGGPGLMVLEANQIWKRYHDTGRFYVFDILPKSVKARIENIEGGGPLLCSVVLGFVKSGLELSGSKDVRVDHNKCIYRGDGFCEYFAKWS